MYLKAHDTCFENIRGKVKVLYWIPQLFGSAENLWGVDLTLVDLKLDGLDD